MPWGEAVRAVQTLADDPTTRIAAALSGHRRPWSHEWAAVVDLFDLMHKVHGKNPKPYPRPWPEQGTTRRGRTNKSRAEVVSILNAHGHRIAG